MVVSPTPDTADDELWPTPAFCAALKISRETAERWRSMGGDQYPPFIKYPGKRGKVVYSKRAVMAWLRDRQRSSTSDN